MSRLNWGTAGERYYETGVDRGVLYAGLSPGVSWNGLVSVSEAPSGGDPMPYYVDGIKYLNLASVEEFVATVTAFSSPREFDACDGTTAISNGLFVTQQPRKSFGLCYRTKIGNDIDGAEHGYKLHLVYNALASSSDRANTTINESTDASQLSWGITTQAAVISGYKASAHLVIDSRYTPKLLLKTLEDILYGTSSTSPNLQSASEISSLFSSPGPVLYKNLVRDPRAKITTAWGYGAGTSGVATKAAIGNAADGPLLPDGTKSLTYMRATHTVADTGVTTKYFMYSLIAGEDWSPNYPTNTPVSAGIYIRSSRARTMFMRLISRLDVNGPEIAGPIGPSVVLPANTWVNLTQLWTVSSAFDRISVRAYFPGEAAQIGDTFDATCGIAVPGATEIVPFFDGHTLPANGVTYSWEGTSGASSSIAKTWGEI